MNCKYKVSVPINESGSIFGDRRTCMRNAIDDTEYCGQHNEIIRRKNDRKVQAALERKRIRKIQERETVRVRNRKWRRMNATK